MVKFGIQHPSFTHDGDGQEIFQTIKKRAQYADVNRVDSFWLMDHFLQIPQVGGLQEPILEAWTTIPALSAVTQKIKLGIMVTGNIYRNQHSSQKWGPQSM